jgi:hypothetical protein
MFCLCMLKNMNIATQSFKVIVKIPAIYILIKFITVKTQKLVVAWLVNKFGAFYKVRLRIVLRTTDSHWSLPEPEKSSPQSQILLL